VNSLDVVSRICDIGVIGIVRVSERVDLEAVVGALRRGGVEAVEITMPSPGALAAIEKIARAMPEALIGAGTVLDEASAVCAIQAGAKFIVSPNTCPGVVAACRRHGAVVVPGAMTPTEILHAWECGADLVKVFPAGQLGSSFIRAVRGPLPQVPLAATGGVNGENAGEFIKAGAAVVCVGGWLVPAKAVASGDYDVLAERAEALVQEIKRARGGDR